MKEKFLKDFTALDIDEDNYLNTQEIKKALERNGIPPSQALIKSIFEEIGTEIEGKISKKEFINY